MGMMGVGFMNRPTAEEMPMVCQPAEKQRMDMNLVGPGRGRIRGCDTCKSRRIKCDRTRPGCEKCVKTGRVCVYSMGDTGMKASGVGTKELGRGRGHVPGLNGLGGSLQNISQLQNITEDQHGTSLNLFPSFKMATGFTLGQNRDSDASSTFNSSPNPDEDWTKISDLAERRRIQNRIAQRNYRKKLKQRLEDLERKSGYANNRDGTNSTSTQWSTIRAGCLPMNKAASKSVLETTLPHTPTPLTSGNKPERFRLVQSRPKPRCWEHGCNGRTFSTFSNLLRHQREMSGRNSKVACPNCGAEFTRTTARNEHLLHDKCRKPTSLNNLPLQSMPVSVAGTLLMGLSFDETKAAQVASSSHETSCAGGWSITEDEQLLALRSRGLTWDGMAGIFLPDKSVNACRERHERLISRRDANSKPKLDSLISSPSLSPTRPSFTDEHRELKLQEDRGRLDLSASDQAAHSSPRPCQPDDYILEKGGTPKIGNAHFDLHKPKTAPAPSISTISQRAIPALHSDARIVSLPLHPTRDLQMKSEPPQGQSKLMSESPELSVTSSGMAIDSSDDEECTGILKSQKRSLLDRLMGEFYSIFSNRNSPQPWARSRNGGGGSRNTSPSDESQAGMNSSSITSATSCSPEGWTVIRKRQSDQDDDDESHGGKRPRSVPPGNRNSAGETSQRFACPYFKKSPEMYRQQRSCPGPGWASVHRVKEHVYRKHALPISCPRCHTTFETDKLKDEHITASIRCELRERVASAEGMNATQKEQLRSRKKSTKYVTEAEKWKEMYVILFPNADPTSVPSPYYELPPGDHEFTSNEFTRYEQFLRQELPARVRQQLELRIDQCLNPVEENLRSELVGIVRDMQIQLFDVYKSMRNENESGTGFAGETGGDKKSLPLPSIEEEVDVMKDLEDELHPFQQPPYIEDFADFDSFDGLYFNFDELQSGSDALDSGYQSIYSAFDEKQVGAHS